MEYLHEIIIAIIMVAGLLAGIFLLGTRGIKINHCQHAVNLEPQPVLTKEEKQELKEFTEKEIREQEQRTKDYYSLIQSLNETLGGISYDDKA